MYTNLSKSSLKHPQHSPASEIDPKKQPNEQPRWFSLLVKLPKAYLSICHKRLNYQLVVDSLHRKLKRPHENLLILLYAPTFVHQRNIRSQISIQFAPAPKSRTHAPGARGSQLATNARATDLAMYLPGDVIYRPNDDLPGEWSGTYLADSWHKKIECHFTDVSFLAGSAQAVFRVVVPYL